MEMERARSRIPRRSGRDLSGPLIRTDKECRPDASAWLITDQSGAWVWHVTNVKEPAAPLLTRNPLPSASLMNGPVTSCFDIEHRGVFTSRKLNDAAAGPRRHHVCRAGSARPTDVGRWGAWVHRSRGTR